MDFTNITISGTVASGKSAAFEGLQTILEPKGWSCYRTGQLVREKTLDSITPTGDLVSEDFNRELEKRTKKLLQTPHTMIEGWLTGFVARDMPTVCRVLLTCPIEERVKRVAKRDDVDTEEARIAIEKRESTNISLWKKLYGEYDFYDTRYYTHVIDTQKSNQMQVISEILGALGQPHA